MKFVLETAPIAKTRPRFTTKGRFPVVYDTQTQKKKMFQVLIRNEMLIQSIQEPLQGVLKLSVTFYMPIPQSTSKKKKNALEGTYHSRKPDLDNLIKFLLDCFNGVLIQDDNCIASIHAEKRYSINPRIEIEIIAKDSTSI